MSYLESIDHKLFQLINQAWSHPIGDQFFPFISNLSNQFWFTRIFLPLLFAFWIFLEKKKAVKTIAVLLLAAGLSDFIGYHLLKENIGRIRPNNHPQVSAVLRLPHSPQSGSFPSNHASSTFALATVLFLVYRKWGGTGFVFAFLVAYSRVYVGVHFPSDVIGGALIGLSLGGTLGCFILLPWLNRKAFFAVKDN